MIGRVEDVHVVRIDDRRLRDAIAKDAVGRREHELVADVDAAERTKDGITMAGDPYVAALARQRRVFDVPRRARERSVVAPLEHRRRQAERGRVEARDPLAAFVRRGT